MERLGGGDSDVFGAVEKLRNNDLIGFRVLFGSDMCAVKN